MSVTTEAKQTTDIAKTLKREDVTAKYEALATKYDTELKQWKLRFYTLYVRMDEVYESCTKEAKEWFATTMCNLCNMKDHLIQVKPFVLEEVDT